MFLVGLSYLLPIVGFYVALAIVAAGALAADVSAPGGVIDPAPEPPLSSRSRAPAPAPSFEDQVVEIVNQERDQAGVPPLKRNPQLDASSVLHSTNMADRDFFNHCDPDTGDSSGDRMTAAGYPWIDAGENIAAGYSTPADVMAAWMTSPGHRNNIESSDYREIGVGYVQPAGDANNVRRDLDAVPDCIPDAANYGPYYRYWTQNFGRRFNVYPVIINQEAYLTDSRDVSLYVYGSGFAEAMRFRNEDGTWSAWESFSQNKNWQLSAGDGEKTVTAEIRNSSSSVLNAIDTIFLELLCSALYDVLNLTAQTITSVELMEACTMITAGSNTVIDQTADVTLRAPDVRFQSGFAVRIGGQLRVQNVTPGE